jgi:hypothetical protein
MFCHKLNIGYVREGLYGKEVIERLRRIDLSVRTFVFTRTHLSLTV